MTATRSRAGARACRLPRRLETRSMPVSSPPRHPRRPLGGDGTGRSMPAVAHLLAEGDRIVGGIAQRADDYALVLGGRVVAATDSAGMAIAMLRHVRDTLASADAPLEVRVSSALDGAATREAESAGLSLDAYLDALEAERVERVEERAARGSRQ